MSDIVQDMLDAIDRALAAVKSRSDARLSGDAENLLLIKRILEGLDPDEIEALLEEDDEEE